MAGEKDIALFFFTNDWMTSANVQALSWEQRGMYHWLLCIGWNEGGIPSDERALAQILGLTRRRFAQVWPAIAKCWEPSEDGTRLRNPRQELERAERNRIKQARAEAGRRGGRRAGEEQANAKQTTEQPASTT